MTSEEKQKAIDALKISAPIMAVTQEEFTDYIQTLNKIMDWLEQEPFINKPCVSSEVCEHDKNEVLDKIRAEIEKPLHDERCFDTADAKAQYIALNWCVEIIDKYRAKSEDLGDYPDTIHNQFDNLTGSMNV